MKHLKLMLVLALAICSITTATAQSKTSAKKQLEKTTVYSWPMKCEGEKMYAEAGKCPDCNMNLKAVTASINDEHKGHNHN